VEQEQKFFADMAAAQNSIFLVAEAGGQIIGNLTCQGGPRQATRHVTVLGMSVAREWRDQGVGSQLMRRAIEWARASQVVKRIELNVFARNQRAIHLYEKFGFAIEGSRRSAIYRDGEYLDDYVMGLLI
jgi:RimJ/RimL family protein N-acetyltransferase